MPTGRGLYQCNRCKKQTSRTAGTIFHATKLALTLRFAAIHLIVAAVSTSPERRPREVKLAPVRGFRKREIGRRYNRRLQLQSMIPRSVHSTARTKPMLYRLLIAG